MRILKLFIEPNFSSYPQKRQKFHIPSNVPKICFYFQVIHQINHTNHQPFFTFSHSMYHQSYGISIYILMVWNCISPGFWQVNTIISDIKPKNQIAIRYSKNKTKCDAYWEMWDDWFSISVYRVVKCQLSIVWD